MTPSESTYRRLHPLYLVFALFGAGRNLLLPGLVVLFAARDDEDWQIWIMVLFFPAAVMAIAKYMSLRYRLEEEELVVSGGVFMRFERHVPYDRIQNVNLVQNVFHRMFGIGAVKIETAAGDEPEASMEALSLDAIEELRSFQRRGRKRIEGAAVEDGTPDPEPPIPLLSLGTRDLVLAGVISNRGLAVVAAALGILWNLDFTPEELWEGLVDRVRQSETPAPPEFSGLTAVGFVLAGIAAIFVLMRVLSITWMIFELHGFRLGRNGDDLELEYGLLTRVRTTVPLPRVQHVTWRQNPLHRLFRRSQGIMVTAGGSSEAEGARRRARLAPIIRRGAVDGLMMSVLPECRLGDLEWHGVAPGAWRRVFGRWILGLAVLCGGAAFGIGAWSIVVFGALVPVVLLHARWWTAALAWARTRDIVACRRGWLGRHITVVRSRKIQAVTLSRSPFDRWRGMATLGLDTAGGSMFSGALDIPFLDSEVAERLGEDIRRESGHRGFEW